MKERIIRECVGIQWCMIGRMAHAYVDKMTLCMMAAGKRSVTEHGPAYVIVMAENPPRPTRHVCQRCVQLVRRQMAEDGTHLRLILGGKR